MNCMGTVLKPEPPRTPKEKPQKTAVILRFDPPFLAEIDAAAAEVGLSRQKAIANLLRFALDANKAKPSKK